MIDLAFFGGKHRGPPLTIFDGTEMAKKKLEVFEKTLEGIFFSVFILP